jgi:hypothetical protein
MSFFDIFRSLGDAIFAGSGTTVLRFDGSQITASGSKILSRTIRDVQDLLQSAGCKRATITIQQNGRITISAGVEEHLHQRIRNIISSC